MGMDNNSIMGYVQHYQRNIERAQDNEQKLLYCIGKLYKLPIKVEHLQETGIGKTVNALRKFDGEIGVAAKALVIKWKAMVAAEEVPKEEDEAYETEANSTAGAHEANEIIRETSPKQQQQHTEASTSHREHRQQQQQQHHTNDASIKHKTHQSRHEQHKTRDKNEKHGSKDIAEKSHKSSQRDKHHVSRSEHKERERHEKQDLHKRHDRSEKTDKDHKKPKEHREHREHKQDKEQLSTSHKEKHDSRKDRKTHSSDSTKKHKDREHKQEKLTSSKDVEHKTTKHNNNRDAARKRTHEHDEEHIAVQKKSKVTPDTSRVNDADVQEDGIDSSMGANFADVLGMLNMPGSSRKSTKKSTSSPQKALSSQRTDAASTSRLSNGFKTSSLSVAALEKKPALLSSTVKLEPLDPNIALELPTISNNYRPMPLNQTVMDCVFNTNSSSATKTAGRMLSDAEALAHSISSKTMRTKIYSGARTGQVHQVPTLFDLCIRSLQKNIDALEYTGGVPFEVLKPVLDRCTWQQLFAFEEYNPYIMEDTDILWKLHVARKYRTAKRLEMESWREMYLRCKEEEDRRLSHLTETIKQKEKIIAAPVRKIQLAFVDTTVKPPRNIARKQEQFGTRGKLIATPAARVAALSSVTPNAARPGDARLRVAAHVRDTAQVSHAPVRAKKAPLMAKTLQFMRGRLKR